MIQNPSHTLLDLVCIQYLTENFCIYSDKDHCSGVFSCNVLNFRTFTGLVWLVLRLPLLSFPPARELLGAKEVSHELRPAGPGARPVMEEWVMVTRKMTGPSSCFTALMPMQDAESILVPSCHPSPPCLGQQGSCTWLTLAGVWSLKGWELTLVAPFTGDPSSPLGSRAAHSPCSWGAVCPKTQSSWPRPSPQSVMSVEILK